jgi:hypothetical protein
MLAKFCARAGDLVFTEAEIGNYLEFCCCLIYAELRIDVPLQDNACLHKANPRFIPRDAPE